MDGELSADPALPLDGVRVLDLSRLLPGWCRGVGCDERIAALEAGYGEAEIAALERAAAVGTG